MHALAKDAAQRTGRSQTEVIGLALEQFIAGLSRDEQTESERRYKETMEVAAFCAARLTDADRGLITEALYDDDGLPA
ncbi:hypothetical protein GCM10027402_08350 [Arthrobacter monumenti]